MRLQISAKGFFFFAFLSFCLLSVSSSNAQNLFQIEFEGSELTPIQVKPETSSGLNSLYVLAQIENVSMVISYTGDNKIEWMRYSNMGGGYAENVNFTSLGNGKYQIDHLEGNMGYIIRAGSDSYNLWIVDYSTYQFKANSLMPSSDNNCYETILDFSGDATPIYYYGISGQQFILSRDIELSYHTLSWDSQALLFREIEETKILASISSQIIVSPPNYCSTYFVLSGDRFLEKWGSEVRIETGNLPPYGVEVATEAIQEDKTEDSEEGSNQINTAHGDLGGSAPAIINFLAYVTDAVVHNEWQISKDPEFEYIDYRFNEQDLTFTFNEEGTYYVRFIGSNSDGSCEAISDTYTVSIGSSELLIPNAFSPNGDGVNDIWKVSYRSLIEFRCWIFDRHGHQLFYFDNPSLGWDGTHNGKKVKSGVYYYVIEAHGADGIKYKKSGDINILNYKYSGSSSSTTD